MDDADSTSPRLEQLEARWEADKGSRVFLQLADEYRRHDRPADAVRVLDEGLERSPGHLGARVARARSLLDLGRTDDAVADLQRVIEADPTQMVAHKLLVEAHVERGDAAAAEESLGIYRMLNDADPAIEDLERRIAGIGGGEADRGEAAAGREPEPPEPAPPAETGAPEPEEAAPKPVPTPTAEEEPAEPFGEVPAAPGEEPAEPLAGSAGSGGGAPQPPILEPGATEPFPALGSGADRRRYLETFEGDLFAPMPGEAPLPEPAEETAVPAGGPEPFELEAAGPEAEGDGPFDLGQPSTPPPADDLLDLEPPALAPEPPAEEPPATAGAPEPVPEVPPLEPEEEAGAAAPAAPASGEPAAAEAEEDRPTVTLARLYQRQGHLEEAAEIFRRVLEREPGHEEARRGLAEVEAAAETAAPVEEGPTATPEPAPEPEQAPPKLRAGELLEGYEPAEHGEGLTARKRYALGRYLERLRGGEGRDVH